MMASETAEMAAAVAAEAEAEDLAAEVSDGAVQASAISSRTARPRSACATR